MNEFIYWKINDCESLNFQWFKINYKYHNGLYIAIFFNVLHLEFALQETTNKVKFPALRIRNAPMLRHRNRSFLGILKVRNCGIKTALKMLTAPQKVERILLGVRVAPTEQKMDWSLWLAMKVWRILVLRIPEFAVWHCNLLLQAMTWILTKNVT